jgi:hypothetical protein
LTTAETTSVDTSALEERLAVLETERRRPRRVGAGDQGILTRLAALESAASTESAALVPTTTDEGSAALSAGAPIAIPQPMQDGPRGEPTEAEVDRFRKLQAAVRKQELIEKSAKRVNRLLDALPVNLTEEQRDGVHTRWASFQPRFGEIWGEAKSEARATAEAGGQVDRQTIVANTNAVIQNEFAGLLGGLINPADSSTIAAALVSGRK